VGRRSKDRRWRRHQRGDVGGERTQSVESDDPAAKRGAPDLTGSETRHGARLPAPAGLLLSLQQTAGNRAVSGLIQRGRMLQRVANYKAKDTRANVVVDDSDNPITLTGSAKDEQGADVELSGKLIYEQVEIPGKAVSSGSRKKRKDALEIKDVVAQPKGIRLGQILVWHLARYAREQGIKYVVAGNILREGGARELFYGPLGFLDYKDARPWKELDARRAQLERWLEEFAPRNVPAGVRAALGDTTQKVVEERLQVAGEMAANKIFVSTRELEEKAYARWSRRWSSQ
jgi:hypothetical protein